MFKSICTCIHWDLKVTVLENEVRNPRHHHHHHHHHQPVLGALFFLLRIFIRFLDMKYGFCGLPSLRSRSSTEGQTQHLKLYSVHVTLYMCVILTETQEECVHTHVIHTEEAVSDQIRTEHHRLSHTHTHTLNKTKHLPDSTVHLVPNSQTTVQIIAEFMYLNKIQFLRGKFVVLYIYLYIFRFLLNLKTPISPQNKIIKYNIFHKKNCISNIYCNA